MSSLDAKLSRSSNEVYQRIVELLHDSDTRWPDLSSVESVLNDLLRIAKDIKYEVHQIEVSRPVVQTKESDKGKEERAVKDDRTTPVPPLDKPITPDNPVYPGLEELQKAYEEQISKGNPAYEWLTKSFLKLFDTSFSPEHVIPRLRHLITNDNIKDVKRDLKTVMKVIDTLPGQFKADSQVIVTKVEELERILDGVVTNQDSITDKIADLSSTLINNTNILRDLVLTTSQTINAGLSTIFDKIVECCVKEDVSELLRLSGNMSNEIDEIRSIVGGGGTPAERNTSGAILSICKSMQADISAIRRLL